MQLRSVYRRVDAVDQKVISHPREEIREEIPHIGSPRRRSVSSGPIEPPADSGVEVHATGAEQTADSPVTVDTTTERRALRRQPTPDTPSDTHTLIPPGEIAGNASDSHEPAQMPPQRDTIRTPDQEFHSDERNLSDLSALVESSRLSELPEIVQPEVERFISEVDKFTERCPEVLRRIDSIY